MTMKATFIFTTGLAIGIAGTCVSTYFYSKSNQKQLAVIASELPQATAQLLAESMTGKLAARAPIVMAALWKNAAIGTAAKKLYPYLVEDFPLDPPHPYPYRHEVQHQMHMNMMGEVYAESAIEVAKEAEQDRIDSEATENNILVEEAVEGAKESAAEAKVSAKTARSAAEEASAIAEGISPISKVPTVPDLNSEVTRVPSGAQPKNHPEPI